MSGETEEGAHVLQNIPARGSTRPAIEFDQIWATHLAGQIIKNRGALWQERQRCFAMGAKYGWAEAIKRASLEAKGAP